MHSQREEVYSAAGDSSPGELVIATQIPPRLAGSENGPRMAEYSAQALRDAGVDARVEELPALVSFRTRRFTLSASVASRYPGLPNAYQ